VLFVDTPGLHTRQRNLLNRAMNRAVEGALVGAEVALFVVEAGAWKASDSFVLEHVLAAQIPVILAVNKVDLVRPKSALLPYLLACEKRAAFHAIVPISAANADNLDRLLDQVTDLLPVGPPLYPLDASTNRSLSFRVAEMIREKLLIALRQEVPYGLAVEILALEEKPGVVLADAVIWADRESHKGIVVGKGGATIKEVGTAARLDLEKIFGLRFYLETHVKVKTNWADSARALQQFGFESNS
jgi:GTP-binding protein Era